MVGLDKFLQVSRTHVFLLSAKSIVQIKPVKTELIRHDDIFFIFDFACHPVMTTDGFKPPDFIFIIKSDAIWLISSILFDQLTKSDDTFFSWVDIRKNKNNQIFFTDSTRNILFLLWLCLTVSYVWITSKHTGICCGCFSCCHTDIGGIDTGSCPDPIFQINIRAACIRHRIVRQINCKMWNHTFILSRLLFRWNNDQLFDIIKAIIVSCNHGWSIIARFFTNKNCCTGHSLLPSFCSLFYNKPEEKGCQLIIEQRIEVSSDWYE